MNLADLKKIVDDVVDMVDRQEMSTANVKLKFKTFDERFEENADEFQEPDEITAVEVDVLKWNSVTITIERKGLMRNGGSSNVNDRIPKIIQQKRRSLAI